MVELIFGIVAVAVAGLAAVVGIWMERDPRRPPKWAWGISILILMAMLVSVAQSYFDHQAGEKLEQDMARMLQQLDKLAADSEDPALQAFVTSELSAQARANPDIVEKLSERVEEDGGDAAEMLSKHMPASEVAALSKKGKVKKKKTTSSAPKTEKQPAKKVPASESPRGGRGDDPASTASEKPESAAKPAIEAPRGGRGESVEADEGEEPSATKEATASPRGESPRGETKKAEEEADSKSSKSSSSAKKGSKATSKKGKSSTKKGR
jgi:hypothetical protein